MAEGRIYLSPKFELLLVSSFPRRLFLILLLLSLSAKLRVFLIYGCMSFTKLSILIVLLHIKLATIPRSQTAPIYQSGAISGFPRVWGTCVYST